MQGYEHPQIIEHVATSVTYSPFDVRWIPSTATFIASGETPRGEGCIQIYDLDEKRMSLRKTVTPAAGIKSTMVFGVVGSHTSLATGDFLGSLSVMDIQSMAVSWTVPGAHSKIINKLDVCGGGYLGSGPVEIATASRDGKVKVWDPRVTEPIVTMDPSSTDVDCWSACFGNAFNDTDRCVAAGYDNGDIKLLDLRTMTLRWEHCVMNGICHLSFDRRDISMNKLSAACLEAQLHVFDMRTFNIKRGFCGLSETIGKSTVWGCHYLPQDREIFATTSGDGSLSLYKYEYPMERSMKDDEGLDVGMAGTLRLLGKNDNISTQPLIAFDWNPDKKGLGITASVDQCLRSIITTSL